jgi:hypothetical protein
MLIWVKWNKGEKKEKKEQEIKWEREKAREWKIGYTCVDWISSVWLRIICVCVFILTESLPFLCLSSTASFLYLFCLFLSSCSFSCIYVLFSFGCFLFQTIHQCDPVWFDRLDWMALGCALFVLILRIRDSATHSYSRSQEPIGLLSTTASCSFSPNTRWRVWDSRGLILEA